MQLHHANDQIEATGARLHVIGNGAPMFIAGFRESTGFRGPIYTDPSLAVYRAAEMRRGLATILHPRGLLNAARAVRAGFRQGRTQGDATQTGGVLIVTPAGEIAYQYTSRAAGDHPATSEILAALAA